MFLTWLASAGKSINFDGYPDGKELFDDDHVARICSIPLPRANLADEIVWSYEGSGCYSVKSGYRLLKNLQPISSIPFSDWLAAFFVSLSASNRREQDSISMLDEHIRSTAIAHWEAPHLSVVKIFDSAFNLQDRSAISGAVVRNSKGLILAACVVPHSNVSDTFVAEALACKNAVQVVKDMRFFEVIIEGDSLTVVKKLNSAIQDSSTIALIIVDIKDLARSFNAISFRFVRRGANKVTHSLAYESHLVQGPRFWTELVPSEVAAAAEADRRDL
ncbi:hypothetical protein V6N11_027073 [Hibiscus sabdariffa]|uniref:RNase H type-1 domain-containing protein n=1 Tax=Hibiscus sabdariffa TaxID=183260 RepID=A0ABR2PGA1_9ROSI